MHHVEILTDYFIGLLLIMSARKFILLTGSIFFVTMLFLYYFFIDSNFSETLKMSALQTLIFVPLNFLLNKWFNKRVFKKKE